MILVPFGHFRQRVDAIEKLLGPLGDVAVEELAADGARTLKFVLMSPGHDLPTRAVFEYRERYERTGGGWLRDRYFYEYRPRPSPSRRAHHDHGPYGVHQHCREAGRAATAPHYRDVTRLLEETHEEFAEQFLNAVEIDCTGLLPPGLARDPRAGPHRPSRG